MTTFLLILYGLFAFVAFLNLLLMPRPSGRADTPSVCVLIPARDEAENLRRLIPALLDPNPGLAVYVFDDESSDGTGEIAARLGARVVRPREPLPAGWTGKNRACYELGQVALAETDAAWLLFLDADVDPAPAFLPSLKWFLGRARPGTGCITAFPHIVPGRWPEPLFLAWVGWILLATNPYGLVARTGMGHNRFTNGQIHAWRREVYARLQPNEAVRHHVLEDVMMGRLLARHGQGVDVLNLASVFSVRMYQTWRQALDGMSKNSYEITGSTAGSFAVAAGLLFVAWGWAFVPNAWPLVLFLASGLFAAMTVRARPWALILLPIAVTIGAYTIVRSVVWRKKGQVVWKGRVYGQEKGL